MAEEPEESSALVGIDELVGRASDVQVLPAEACLAVRSRIERETSEILGSAPVGHLVISSGVMSERSHCEGLAAALRRDQGSSGREDLVGEVMPLALEHREDDRAGLIERLESARGADGSGRGAAFLALLDAVQRETTVVETIGHVDEVRRTFPALPPGSWERSPTTVELSAGLELRARPGLLIAAPEGAPSVLADWTTDAAGTDQRAARRFSTLVFALRTGRLPALVATWHLGTGGATVDEVTYDFLGAAVDDFVDALRIAVGTDSGRRSPRLSAGPHCRRCPACADCPAVDGLERLAAVALGTGATVWPVDPKGWEQLASELLGPEMARRLLVGEISLIGENDRALGAELNVGAHAVPIQLLAVKDTEAGATNAATIRNLLGRIVVAVALFAEGSEIGEVLAVCAADAYCTYALALMKRAR